jgi:hypothetical protein
MPWVGVAFVPDEEIHVADVEAMPTRSGNTRWVVRSDRGKEFTTFRPDIGRQAERYRGRGARVRYHEEERGGFHNVYLDDISGIPGGASPPAGGSPTAEDRRPGDADPEAVAWNAAIDAAPWLVGPTQREGSDDAKELYERLRPFKDLVTKDIRESNEENREQT